MEATRASFVALPELRSHGVHLRDDDASGNRGGPTLAPDEQRGYAGTLRGSWSPSFGGGGVLEEHVARGIVFARLANFVEGNAKTRPVIAERIAALLDGPLPGPSARRARRRRRDPDARAPLMNADRRRLRGGGDDGACQRLASAAALAADVALAARHRLHAAERVFALSIEAFGAPLDAYDEALEDFWEDENEIAALHGLRGYLEGALRPIASTTRHPSATGSSRAFSARRTAPWARSSTRTISLRSVTDNPVYVPPDERHPLGRAISTGGYHTGWSIPAMSALAAAWADVVFLVERHVTAMHVGATSELPAARAAGRGAAARPTCWAGSRGAFSRMRGLRHPRLCCRPESAMRRTTSAFRRFSPTARNASSPTASIPRSRCSPPARARRCGPRTARRRHRFGPPRPCPLGVRASRRSCQSANR